MRDEPLRIAGDLTVGTLLERWPTLVSTFRRRGLSCPGCVMSPFDTLDYVARVYGLDGQEWLRELRRERAGAPRGRKPSRSATRPHGRMSHETD